MATGVAVPMDHSSKPLQELLAELSNELLKAPDLESMLWIVARTARSALNYEDCVLYLLDHEHQILAQRAADGPKSPEDDRLVNPITIRVGEGIVGNCARLREPVLVHDTYLDDRYIVDDQVRRSELAVPLFDGDTVIGVIDSEHSDVGFYTDQDRQALVQIASIAGVRLHAAMATEELESAVAELEHTKVALDVRLRTDHLTGLSNRRGFEEKLQIEGTGRFGALGLVDLDSFKQINDTLGHAAGDNAIIGTARALQETAPIDGFVARLGGDEFGLLARDLPTLEDWCNRVLPTLNQRVKRSLYGQLKVTASAGLVERRTQKSTWGLADDALFVAKAGGGDQVVVYRPDDIRLQKLRADRNWASKIRTGLHTNFLLLGQPIVSSSDRSDVAMYEMLLRYRTASGGLVRPNAFLPIAETFRLHEDIDCWVAEETIRWLSTQPESVHAAANVTSHFIESPHAISTLESLLSTYGVLPARLCLEITESIAIADERSCAEFVRAVRGWGCKVAIDDFGKGWTSLPLVRDLGVDILKIDGAWVTAAINDQLARTVVESIIAASNILELDVVAEWVESRAVASYFSDLGVRFLQGHFIGEPAELPTAVTMPQPLR